MASVVASVGSLILSFMFDTDCDLLSLFVLLKIVRVRLSSLNNDKFFVISHTHTHTLPSRLPLIGAGRIHSRRGPKGTQY